MTTFLRGQRILVDVGGEPEGLREFVAAVSPRLLRSAFAMTGELASAEDLVQGALVKVWRNWDKLQRADQPESYAQRIVLNEFLGDRRRRWSDEKPSSALPDAAVFDPVLVSVEDRLEMQRALQALTRGQRAVLVLRYLDDLSEGQTAELLGITVGTVKSQTARALSNMRAVLTQETRQEIQ